MQKSSLLLCQILFIVFLVLSSWLHQSIAAEIKKQSSMADRIEYSLISREDISTLRNEYDNKISKLEKELADSKRKTSTLRNWSTKAKEIFMKN